MLGTVYIYEDASRPTQPDSRRLKYGNGLILVPQPSEDPNDPLVRKRFAIATSQILMEAELAIMEARLSASFSTLISSGA